jgi:oligopeptide/dipeptide ABC transporter ATP-binding protein
VIPKPDVKRTFGGARDPAAAALVERQRDDLVVVQDLRVYFPQHGNLVRAVDGVTCSLAPGATLGIIGESGSGKTVTARAIMGLLPQTAIITGSVRFEGIELVGMKEKEFRRHRGSDFSMIYQDPARSLNPTMRVGTQLTEAIRAHLPMTRQAARDRAVELLSLVRLPLPRQRAEEYPHQFSGGMRQRVVIAMALACNPKLVIADEPTTALDVTTQAQIMELLMDLQAQFDMALILISHDMGLAASFTDEVAVMYGGRIVEKAPTRQLFSAVRMPYTQALLEAVPQLERESHSLLPSVPGRPPDPTSRPAGCSFGPRCPRIEADCREASPPLVEHEPGRSYACFHPLTSNSP